VDRGCERMTGTCDSGRRLATVDGDLRQWTGTCDTWGVRRHRSKKIPGSENGAPLKASKFLEQQNAVILKRDDDDYLCVEAIWQRARFPHKPATVGTGSNACR
jgi:hypothetical protein